jgi:Kef-type K+ transport system membrane component KefB
LSFGFLLLLAFFAGKLAERVRLPRLTGYILAGVAVGPSALQLVSRDMVHSLGPVQGVAISLIALTAGGELNLRRLRPLLKVIGWMVLLVVLGSALASGLALLALRPWLPFLAAESLLDSAVIAVVLGVCLSAMSPAVVVLFALAASLAQAVLGSGASLSQTALHVGWELFGSALAGVALGALVALYLRKVQGSRALFVLLICVVMSEVGSRLGLDPLIIGLTAGLFMENVAEIETTHLVHEIEGASLPVFTVFFAVAGAALRLDILSQVAVPAALLVLIRTAAVWGGSRLAARRADADPMVRRWAFAAFLPQAGLALALPLMFPRILGGAAEGAAALVLGIVGINQVIMPVLLRVALTAAGETGKAEAPPPSAPEAAPAHPSRAGRAAETTPD